MKKLLLNIHLWVGLAAAVFLIVLSVTGSIIAFEGELNRAFHPGLTTVAPTGQRLTWDAVKQDVEASQPGWKASRFYFPATPTESTYMRLRSVATHKNRHIYVNQYTGQVLGSTEDGSNWIIKIHGLHVNMMGGKVGNAVVVAATYCLLALSITGIILWWPRKVFRFKPKSPLPRLNSDLHHTVGFWSSLAMFLFAITGLALHYQTGQLLDLLNTGAAEVRQPGRGTSIEGMLQAAREALPGAQAPRLLLPEKAGEPVFLYMRFPEDRTPAGRSFVTIDAKTGEVLTKGSTRNSTVMHTALVEWSREVHTGSRYGHPTQAIAALFGLSLSVLALTGPFIWLNKRRAAARGRRALKDRERFRTAV